MFFIFLLFILCLTFLLAIPSKTHAHAGNGGHPEKHPDAPRKQQMLEAANAISVMLFSDNFELGEIGEKALECMGIAVHADFIELWKHHPHEKETVCNQIYWWEKEDRSTHSRNPLPISYDCFFTGWHEELAKGNTVTVTKTDAPPEALRDLECHEVESFIIVPVFFQGAMWGFLRLAPNKDEPPLTTDEQKIVRSMGLFLVASIQRNNIQMALKISEDRFRDVTQATGEIIWELSPNGFFSYISNRIEELAGYSASSLIGKRWEDISTTEYADSITSLFFQTGMIKNVFDNLEHAILDQNGETIWLRSAAKLIIDSAGVAGLRGTSFNYTESRETALQLDSTLRELQRSNRKLEIAAEHAYALAEKANSANAAKQDFLANISHEIRTPLNSITGMLYLLEKTNPSQLQQSYIEQVKESSSALVTIVDNILNFTRLQSGEVESTQTCFSVAELFREIAAAFQRKLADKNLQSIFSIAPEVPLSLKGDAASLRQILNNLFDNAIKFTENGTVAIICTLLKQLPGNIILQFHISDTGIGMTPEQQTSMLEAFAQRDSSSTRKFGGAGLGLSVAYQLVRLNNGSFTVSSTPNEGTVIAFSYGVSPVENSLAAPLAKAEQRHVLVLIDENSPRTLHAGALQDAQSTIHKVTVRQLAGYMAKAADDNIFFTAMYIPSSILQTQSADLEKFFKAPPCPVPMVVALTAQSHFSKLPAFITHYIAGPIFSFEPPVPITDGQTSYGYTAAPSGPNGKNSQHYIRERLDTIITLLNDSDAEGYTLFNQIKDDLTRLDEKTAMQAGILLNVFQFSEAIPLLIKLKDAIQAYEN